MKYFSNYFVTFVWFTCHATMFSRKFKPHPLLKADDETCRALVLDAMKVVSSGSETTDATFGICIHL